MAVGWDGRVVGVGELRGWADCEDRKVVGMG